MSEPIRKNEIRFQSVKNQYVAIFAANIISLSFGCMLGWTSPALAILASDDTPLKTGPLSNEDVSWIGSISSIGGIFGTFIFGYLAELFGCKRVLLAMSLPWTLFWIIIYFGDTYYHILIARILCGLAAGGIVTTCIIYTSEIANKDIRGKLCSLSYLTRNTGILVGYIAGAYLEYKTIACLNVFLPIAFFICFLFFPNTPQYHLRKGQLKKADLSLRYYNGLREATADEASTLIAELERLQSISSEPKVEEKCTLKDIFNRKSLKPLSICMTLAFLEQLTGISVIVTYPVAIFKQVGASHIDPYMSSIIMAIMKILGTLCTSMLSDSLGRKWLFICSFFACGSGLLSFAVYSYLKQSGYDLSEFDWMPVAGLAIVVFGASSGVIPLYSICTVETLPTKIRTIGLTICNTLMNISAFTSLKLFPILSVQIGIHSCMSIFGIACIFGAFFVHFALKETKGKALDIIHHSNGDKYTKCNSDKC